MKLTRIHTECIDNLTLNGALNQSGAVTIKTFFNRAG